MSETVWEVQWLTGRALCLTRVDAEALKAELLDPEKMGAKFISYTIPLSLSMARERGWEI